MRVGCGLGLAIVLYLGLRAARACVIVGDRILLRRRSAVRTMAVVARVGGPGGRGLALPQLLIKVSQLVLHCSARYYFGRIDHG